MKNAIGFCAVLTTLALALALTEVRAGDKKDKDKKKPDDIVINSELIKVDLKDKVIANSFCKTYTITMEKDKSYQMELKGTTFRPYLRLENSTGQQVGADFDRFGNQSAVLVHRPVKKEDFQIIVTSLNAGATGKFTLIVKELTGDEGKPIDLKLAKGEVKYQGSLTRTDPKYSGKIHKLFFVQLEKGSTYQIDQSSKALDAYLYLLGPDGNVLAQNDDNGESLDSRIIHKVATSGQYRIVATSLGGTSIGAFTLTVRQTGGDPPKEEKKDGK